MNRVIQLILLMMISSFTFSQSDTIIIYYNKDRKETIPQMATYYTIAFEEKGSWHRYDFYAEDDKLEMDGYYEDKSLEIKTGPFKYYHKNGEMSSAGFYRQNKKIGQWLSWSAGKRLIDSSFYNQDGVLARTSIRWYESGQVSDSIICDDIGDGYKKSFWIEGSASAYGKLLKGKRSGKWTYYVKSGSICQEVIYEADSAMRFTCYDNKGNVQSKNCYYEKEAEFKGKEKWGSFLGTAMTNLAPKAYWNGEFWGTVMVSFAIDTDGSVVDVSIWSSTESRLNDAAINIIKSSPKWEPAIQYNRPVKAFRKQPMTFTRVQQ